MDKAERQQSAWEMKFLRESGGFAGYASVFDVVDSEQDVVLPGAFAKSLRQGKDIKLLWQHETAEPIGVITALREDKRGLYVEGKLLLEVGRAREAHALMKAGALNGLSIGYRVNDARMNARSGVRELVDIELLEISLVTFPANADARVLQVKAGLQEDIRMFERFLREAGFSRKRAKEIALHGFGCKGGELMGDSWMVLDMALERAIGVLRG